ncbi:MAG: hypothetical protein IGS39_03315 [Calothrix sp. C42_A2020_038]|nr:hypothetical protein [Calothrix sp. C42_A2020_038]
MNLNTIILYSKYISLLKKRNFNTPQLLKAGLYIISSASFLLALITISSVQMQRQAIKSVAKDSIPSVITAQRIKDTLVGMEANAVDELLIVPTDYIGAPQEYEKRRQSAIASYEERRKAFSERIIIAARNITYGDAELKPIETLQLKLGDYIAKLQRAREFHERGDTNGTLIAHREASQIMDNTLIPAVDQLDKVNLQQLERIYAQISFQTTCSLFLILIFGTLLLSVLVITQVFLYRRMRRILNPMLLAATAITLIFIGHITQSLIAASSNLVVAKEDAFESLYALRQARAIAYAANADKSRYLLDRQNPLKHEQAFFQKVNQIVKLPVGQTWNDAKYRLIAGKKVEDMTGLLATDINNINFPGEHEALITTISTFYKYLDIDKQIRQLERSGKHLEAVKLSTGKNQGESNWAFSEFKKAHQASQDINIAVMNKSIEQSFQNIQVLEVITVLCTFSISTLALFGLRRRLREYEI